MNDIEKAARLMGYDVDLSHDDFWVLDSDGNWLNTWNPRTNKADLSDVIDELGISVEWDESTYSVLAIKKTIDFQFLAGAYGYFSSKGKTKFAARAEAVMSVVSELYAAKYGKEGK